MLSQIKRLFLIALVCISIHAIPQSSRLDSVVKTLGHLSDSLLVDSIIKSARMHAIKAHGNLAIEEAKWALNKAKEFNNRDLIARAQFYLAAGYDEATLLDSSVLHYHKALEVIQGSSYENWDIHIYLNLGTLLRTQEKFKESIDVQLEGLKIVEENADSFMQARFMTNIGYAYDRLKEFKEAIQWHQKALKIFEGLSDEYQINFVKGRIGIAYDELSEYDSAHYYNKQALEYAIKIGDSIGIGQTASNIGNTYNKQSQWENALYYLELSFQVNDPLRDPMNKSISGINLGRTLMELGQYVSAADKIEYGIQFAMKSESKIYQSEGYLRLHELYLKLNKPDSALILFKKHQEIEEELYNIEKAKQIDELRTLYETEKKEQQIEIQNARIVDKERKIEANRKLIILLVLLIVSITILSFLVYQRFKTKKETELQKKIIEEQEKGLDAVIHAQEEERKRISKELHDGIGQQLSGLKMNFQRLGKQLEDNSGSFKKEVDQLTNIISESADEVRSISHQMMPRALVELGLVEAITDLTKKALISNEILCDFEHYNLKERYNERIEVSVYRIVQELINNIIKHSEATQVNIQLFQNKQKLILIVEDNGKGFNQDNHSDGHGLLNIKSRLNTLKGEVNFEPSPKSGSIATIRIQL